MGAEPWWFCGVVREFGYCGMRFSHELFRSSKIGDFLILEIIRVHGGQIVVFAVVLKACEPVKTG